METVSTRSKQKRHGWMEDIPFLYGKKLPISNAKERDLLSLCKDIQKNVMTIIEICPAATSKIMHKFQYKRRKKNVMWIRS